MPDFPFLVPLNDKENFASPIQTERKTQLIETPCLNISTGNKVSEPMIKTLIVKRSNSMINESFFSEAETTPSYSNFLSPDLVGGLFPKEISTNHGNMECIEKLYKTFRGSSDNSTNLHSNDSILPSPSITDSGFYSKSESFGLSRSLSVPVTPPSNFKWNRKEFRTDHLEESILTDDDSNDEYIPIRNHFESTQIFDNESCLADNVSMRRLSRIMLKSSNNCISNSSSNENSILNKNTFNKRPLKSFVNSKINNSSGFGSFGESPLSTDNTNSNEIHKQNKRTPYYRSSPHKISNRKIRFNLNIHSSISPIVKPLSIINKEIIKNSDSNFSQISLPNSNNCSIDFTNSKFEIDSPISSNDINSQKHIYKRYDLNGSFIVPQLNDLDISPIHSDTDID